MLAHEPAYRLKLRRSKIVATIGPSSESEQQIKAMITAGVNIFRLNFAYGNHQTHRQAVYNIRQMSSMLNRPVAVLGDLSGPKIRIGDFAENELSLTADQSISLATDLVVGTNEAIPVDYANFVEDIDVGQQVLIDDGRIALEITAIESKTRATAKVVRAGLLRNHMSVNIPGTTLSQSTLTKKDLEDLQFCVRHDLEFVALSYVRTAQEIVDAKATTARMTKSAPNVTLPPQIIAKIEKPEALTEIEAIIDAADGILIARGDLGIELPPQKVPILQNQLIELANKRNKPVIVATQMLESMVQEAQPTRAEVSDVANAVMGNTDAVMLSDETAVGQHPVKSVQVMDAVLREVETYQWTQGQFGVLASDRLIYELPNALARACTLLSQDVGIRAVNVLTTSGTTAKIMSAVRPNAPILAYSGVQKVVNQMVLYWGVFPILTDGGLNLETFIGLVNETVQEMNIAEPGNYILLVSTPRFSRLKRPASSIMLCQVSERL